MIKSERERDETRQKQKQLSQKMSEAEYMERKIRKGDKEQDRKWDEKEKEWDKDGGHKSRKEQR